MAEEWTLGIDFGTTNTRISFRGAGIPNALPIGNNNALIMPSVAQIDTKENRVVTVGESAIAEGGNPERVQIHEIKKFLLQAQYEEPFHPLKTEEIIEKILKGALDRAWILIRNTPGLPSYRSITDFPTRLGIPVIAEGLPRKKMTKIMQNLGFSNFVVENIDEEPSLAISAYSALQQVSPGEKIMIYDLGGGTFDVAFLKVDDVETITVLASDGEMQGGSDIDSAFKEYILERLPGQLGFPVEDIRACLDAEPFWRDILINRTRILKENLSDLEEDVLSIQGFLNISDIELKVTRDDLETLVENMGLFQKTAECCLRAFKRNMANETGTIMGSGDKNNVLKLNHQNLTEDIDRIILVGGATQMPLIAKSIREQWPGLEITGEEVPNINSVSVSMGAAWQEVKLSPVLNRLPVDIIVGMEGEKFQRLYQAYTNTSEHKANAMNPEIRPYECAIKVNQLAQNLNKTVFSLVDSKGDVKYSEEFNLVGHKFLTFRIDPYNRILILDVRGRRIHEINNPYQHQSQKSAYEKYLENQDLERNDQRDRHEINLNRNPFLDN